MSSMSFPSFINFHKYDGLMIFRGFTISKPIQKWWFTKPDAHPGPIMTDLTSPRATLATSKQPWGSQTWSWESW
jgi:hypothetical protein